MLYRLLFGLVLRRVPAETAHRLAMGAARAAGRVPGLPALLARLLAPHDPVLQVEALGRRFPGPLLLAAGFDKDAVAPDALARLGFAGVEIGTVTALPQPGNPQPRLARLPADRALVNRMGFNNAGSAAAARRLARRSPAERQCTVVGANIGRSKATPERKAVADYVESARRLAVVADYVVVNVSSPNTPGLRDLQAVASLRPLLVAVRAALDEAAPAPRIPLLVKIAPDLDDDDVDAVGDLALDLGLDGVIATNTTVGREGLASPPAVVRAAGAGGLSGRPLARRSLAVLRRLHARTGGRVLLVAAGGIETADEAWERILAGATLVQAYTGFVYGGPLWPSRIHRGLARRVREAGYASVRDAVGAGAAADPVRQG